MRYYEVPVLTGTTEEKVEQIAQYLFRQVNDLNYNLENTTAEKFWQKTLEALDTVSGENSRAKSEEELRRDEYNSLRALVVKSATSVLKVEDSFSHTLTGSYLAESDFGSFMEQGFVNVGGSPYTIAQLYRYQSTVLNGVNEYKTELEGYIETGVLDRDTDNPVFGMDIGYNKNKFIFNGKEYNNANPSKIRITPTKIGFYEGSYEVAYIEKKAVYFPMAHITGGSLNINDNCTIDSNGYLKAKNADIEGVIKAQTGYIGGFEITSSSVTTNEFWPCSIASTFIPSDDSSNEYAIFLRGNYGVGKTTYGALTKENNLIGIKKRKAGSNSWSNDISPYTFRVSVLGNIYGNEIEVEGRINGKYIKANSDRVAIGMTDTQAYSKPIELQTSGEILLGRYASKAKNIYLLASDNIRIGQHSDVSSESSAGNYPSTDAVQIEAKTRIDIGSAPETADKTRNIYLNAIYTRSNGSFIPAATATYNLGHSNYVWNKAFIRHITSDADIRIGKNSDTFSGNIYVETDGNLYMGHDAVPNTNVYIVASNTIRIGQNDTSLKTTAVHIKGTSIYFNGTVYVNGVELKV